MQVTPAPFPNQLPAFRIAALAFRKQRQLTWHHYGCHRAAVRAILAAYPDMTEAEASEIAVASMAYESTYHAEWFRKGAAKSPWA